MEKNLNKWMEILFEAARKDYAAQEAGQAFAYRLDEMYSELADMLPPVDYTAVEEEYIPLVQDMADAGMRWAHRRGFLDCVQLIKAFSILQ